MNDAKTAALKPLSGNARDGSVNRVSQCLATLFFTTFFLGMGVVWLYLTFPVFKMIAARKWPATPCVIVSSGVRGEPGSHGYVYSVNIAYTYHARGREFTGDRYQFVTGASSGYAAKAAVAERYPAGTNAVCYVNPADPGDAVIERGFTGDMWWAFLSLPFIVIGGFPLGYGVYAWITGKPWSGAAPGWTGRGSFDAAPAAGRELKPVISRKAMLIGVTLFALIWNALILIPVMTDVVPSLRTRHPEWGVGIFLLIFVAIGIKFLITAAGRFLALFNPAVRITVNPGEARLGEPLELQWNLQGRTDALSRLRITLLGSEDAARGSRKAKSVFFETGLLDTRDKAAFSSGRTRVTLPRNAMHTLDAGHNKIAWEIRVEGTIPRWPDIEEEYPLTVLPAGKEMR
jgi:hypothetical protein